MDNYKTELLIMIRKLKREKVCVWINGSFDILVNFTIHSFYVYFTCLNPIQRSQPLSIC